jgi:aerobic carbon-monoxide dehydrogenase medium subunit
MIPEPFEYHAPKDLADAARLVGQFGADGKVLAGGHSLVPLMKLRLAAPKHLIDITGVAELNYICEEGGRLHIGALASHYQMESSELLKAKCPLLPQTAREIGDVQVRNKGTIGGSLAHADPAADWPAAIVALDAEILATSARGERQIPASQFFLDMLSTALQPDEILTAIRVAVLPAHSGDAYVKMHHPASGFAVVGVAARVTLDEKGSVAAVAVGVTGIGPKAYRAEAVEAALRGKSPSSKRVAEACAHAADGIEANDDLFASAEYRRNLARVYASRAIEIAVERASA